MAAVYTIVKGGEGGAGRVREYIVDITFDANYATGGVPIVADDLGLMVLYGVKIVGQATVAGTLRTTAFYPEFDHKNNRLQFFGSNGAAPAALAEMANATSLATFVVRAQVVGA